MLRVLTLFELSLNFRLLCFLKFEGKCEKKKIIKEEYKESKKLDLK